MRPCKQENLIYLVWEVAGPDLGSAITRVVETLPLDITLDVERGVWRLTNPVDYDPAKGVEFEIGSRDFRDISSWAWRSGTIAVFDRTELVHLDNLVAIAELQMRRIVIRVELESRMLPVIGRY